jgi:hypothetical protein
MCISVDPPNFPVMQEMTSYPPITTGALAICFARNPYTILPYTLSVTYSLANLTT